MKWESEDRVLMKGIRSLANILVLFRLVGRLMFDPRVPLRLKLMLPAAIVYLLSPWDVVPDILPVMGRIDDLVVLLVSAALFLGMSPRRVVTDLLRRMSGGTDVPEQRDGNRRPTVIDGDYRIVDEDK